MLPENMTLPALIFLGPMVANGLRNSRCKNHKARLKEFRVLPVSLFSLFRHLVSGFPLPAVILVRETAVQFLRCLASRMSSEEKDNLSKRLSMDALFVAVSRVCFVASHLFHRGCDWTMWVCYRSVKILDADIDLGK